MRTVDGDAQNIHRIQGLDCFSDFYETIVCFWEVVNSSSDCTKDFNLDYTDISYRWKKQWWDKIPDPAKSSLSTVIQNQHGTSNETSKSANPCGGCLKNVSKAHGKPQADQQRQKIKVKYNIRENCTLEKYTLEPENEVVVVSFELCSQEKEDRIFSVYEVVSENEDASHLPSIDSSICSTFHDILNDSSTPEMGAFENLTTGNILWGFQTQETRLPSSEILPEVGCPSHRSDGCSVEDLQRIAWTYRPYKAEA
ncbi:uncharacterized protein LOC121008876 isoform X1 [Bufo bufo]|uniref:uncharacterized protein LOC121008876 isoform X1 n=1 Tax=Bufo bufo TaxID=8384 RepID=UPI001ABDECA2|nr:uncharacterized protein LOC121008876 isoform X1 [Bufo bufo]